MAKTLCVICLRMWDGNGKDRNICDECKPEQRRVPITKPTNAKVEVKLQYLSELRQLYTSANRNVWVGERIERLCDSIELDLGIACEVPPGQKLDGPQG